MLLFSPVVRGLEIVGKGHEDTIFRNDEMHMSDSPARSLYRGSENMSTSHDTNHSPNDPLSCVRAKEDKIFDGFGGRVKGIREDDGLGRRIKAKRSAGQHHGGETQRIFGTSQRKGRAVLFPSDATDVLCTNLHRLHDLHMIHVTNDWPDGSARWAITFVGGELTIPSSVKNRAWVVPDALSLPVMHTIVPALDHAARGFPTSARISIGSVQPPPWQENGLCDSQRRMLHETNCESVTHDHLEVCGRVKCGHRPCRVCSSRYRT